MTSPQHDATMAVIKVLVRALCHVHGTELARVPRRGPLILVANHVNFLEVPVVYTHLLPRRMTGLAKAETWNTPLAFLFRLAGAIPLRRGVGDAAAFRQALAALERGDLLAIAPEGTRSGDGRLRPAQPGVALLALHSRAPVLPLAYWGGEAFWRNLRRLRRTHFHIAVGQPFQVAAGPGPATQATRQAIADEIMTEIAALLPAEYRGVYAGRVGTPPRHLRPLTGS